MRFVLTKLFSLFLGNLPPTPIQVSLADYSGKYVVVYFYPLDFTFVCPTEIIAFSDRIQEFKDIGCEVDTVNLWTRNVSGTLE